jgi:hypothetical protein
MRMTVAFIVNVLLVFGSRGLSYPLPREDTAIVADRYLTFGIFIGSIEEGARIFTPVRFLPFEDPEALGHQFPTVLQFHGGEDRLLVDLGRHAGLLLGSTLQRYPTEPDSSWPYTAFRPPPVADFKGVSPIHEKGRSAPLPGLRAVAYMDSFPVAFIIDTRGMSLSARHMDRATSSGLDVTRAQVLDALRVAARIGPPKGPWILVYDHP